MIKIARVAQNCVNMAFSGNRIYGSQMIRKSGELL